MYKKFIALLLIFTGEMLFADTDFSYYATTQNEAAVAAQLDSITNPSEVLTTVLDELLALPVSEIPDMLGKMSGEQYTTMIPSNQYATRRFIRHVYTAVSNSVHPYICNDECNADLWAQVGGGRDFLRGNHNSQGYKSDYWDISVGAQTLFTQNFLIGIAGNYAQDHHDFNQGGCTTWNDAQGAIYGACRTDLFYIFADIMGGGSRSTFKTDTFLQKTKSHPQVFQGTFYGELGVDLCILDLLVQPFIGVEIGRYKSKEIDEEGGGVLNLRIENKTKNTLNTSLGAHITSDYDAIRFRGDIAWQHCFDPLKCNMENQFLAFGSPFFVKGINQDQDGVWGVFNLSTNTSDIFNLYAEFIGEWWPQWCAYGFDFGCDVRF